MQFQFDPNQDFQLEAIASVVDLFDGQRRVDREVAFRLGGIPAVPNRLDLSDDELLRNLRAVQKRSFDPGDEDPLYQGDAALQWLEGETETADGRTPVRFANFSVEMETGTGKTYVYLRTALELARRYGLRKFIVVVPSVAIREGVLKTLEMTRAHFRELFDNAPYRFYAYDSANLSQVRQFALSDSVEFMVMTLAAFNKKDVNVIHQSTDRLQGATPIHLVQAARPVLILDEPQNMESQLSRVSLADLNPLLALRYSATHRNPYNVVYRLTPAEAYRRKLVKRIEVASTVVEGETLRPFVRLLSTRAEKRTFSARLAIHRQMRGGTIKEQEIVVKPGDSLWRLSGERDVYEGYDIDEIHHGEGWVSFTNTERVAVGEEIGGEKASVFAAQIRYTVEEHAKKQATLAPLGIKVLTLFFIDRVDNYAAADGIIRREFERAFHAVRDRLPQWKGLEAAQVQGAYFAQKTRKGGAVELQDSSTGTSKEDKEAYELIMRDKERLLSFEEPTAFIFSHSALREGWDNPNVFQICTLNQAVSEVRKRQEIGRGVRLCVDQTGGRVFDERVNVLTVVANESYEAFVAQYQSEIGEEFRAEVEARFGKPFAALTEAERRQVKREYGEFMAPKPVNARARKEVHLRKERYLRPEFRELWERIARKTRYAVTVDTERLIEDVVLALHDVTIRSPRVTVTKARVNLNDEGAFQAWQMSGSRTLVSLAGRYPLPNLVELMSDLMEQTSPPMRLTRRTLLEIIRRAPAKQAQAAVDNPNEFAAVVVGIIKEKLGRQL
ncbi:MAG: DEAD/DEAH box helicase family protein, partial [Candidatus Promineofilum sp.]|nr:DEAD/DEAH box helicase family protein [Promineifilum sp.]